MSLGGTVRWWLGELVLTGDGFPWTTFAINLTGSLALALLPAQRRSLAAGSAYAAGTIVLALAGCALGFAVGQA